MTTREIVVTNTGFIRCKLSARQPIQFVKFPSSTHDLQTEQDYNYPETT